MRKLICLSALLLLLTACGTESVSETVPEQTVSQQEENITETTPDIPEGAVLKRTEIYYKKSQPNKTYIYYLDAHDNPLLWIMIMEPETNQPTFVISTSYEYDQNGNILHESREQKTFLSEKSEPQVLLSETVYEYDADGNCLFSDTTQSNDVQITNRYVYDQYGNETVNEYYNKNQSGETSKTFYYEYEYNDNGNILVSRKFMQNSGEEKELNSTVTNTYDENNLCLSSETIYESYLYYQVYQVTNHYEYDADGNQILDDEVRYSAPDELEYHTKAVSQYDQQNRMTHHERRFWKKTPPIWKRETF